MYLSLPLIKGIVSVGAVAAVGGASALVIKDSKVIKNWWNSIGNQSTTQEGENLPVSEVDYVYFVGKYTVGDITDTTDLYSSADPKVKQYLCQFDKTAGEAVQDGDCEIFKLNTSNSSSNVIDVKATNSADATSTAIKLKANLTADKHYLLRLSKKFADALRAASKTELKVLVTGVAPAEGGEASTPKTFATFSKLVDLSQETQKVNSTVAQSKLFSVVITTAAQSSVTTFAADDTYKCTIGTETDLPCKVYALTSHYATAEKSTVDASAKRLSANSELALNKHVLVELTGTQKSLADLDGKIVILKSSDSTAVVTGLAEHLLVGSAVDAATPANNNLFVVSDNYPTLTQGTVDGTEKAYILTTGAAPFTLPNSTTYAASNYLCRVIADGQKFDDDTCKLFAFPKTDAQGFDLANYKNGGTAISAIADLGANKHQIVELKQSLQTKLNTPGATLHLVQSNRKDKAINNKLVTLTRETDITKAAADATTLKTDLFLVRYKNDKPSQAVTFTTPTTVTCALDGTDLPCKIYKFGSSPKLENTLTTEEVASLTLATTTNDFAENSYYAIELSDTRKGVADLQNKTFTLKTGSTTLGTFDFDQVIFGKAGIAGLPDKAELDTYLVKKPAVWNVDSEATSYRCKLAVDGKKDNYDSSCQLVKMTVSGSETVTNFEHLKTLTTKIPAANLHSDTDTFYKLIVNKKLFYNLDFNVAKTPLIQVQVIKGSNETMGNLEITHKLQNDKYIGKTSLVLAKVKNADTTATGVLDNAKCSLTKDTTVVAQNQISCEVYTTTKGSAADGKNLTFSETKVQASTTYNADDYFLIKLTESKDIADFDNKNNIYYQIPATDGGSTHRNVEFDIVALMAGEATAGKKPIFIKVGSVT